MAGQTSDSDDASGIFWPGYVDAISNLVLNLLFLVMILCLAIFVLSQNSQRPSAAQAPAVEPQDTRHPTVQPRHSTRLSTGGTRDSVQKRAEVEVLPSPAGQLSGATQIKGQTVTDQGVYLEVHFVDDALELGESAQQVLREHLQPLLKAGFSQWQMVVTTDTAFASMRRSALLRLLRVRDTLVTPELPGLKGSTRIESGGTPATTAVVKLYGRRPTPGMPPPETPRASPVTSD